MERTEEERRERERVCVSVCVISKVHRIFLASRAHCSFPTVLHGYRVNKILCVDDR